MATIITFVLGLPMWVKVLLGAYCVVAMFFGFIFGASMGGDASGILNPVKVWTNSILCGAVSAVAFLFLFPFVLPSLVYNILCDLGWFKRENEYVAELDEKYSDLLKRL